MNSVCDPLAYNSEANFVCMIVDSVDARDCDRDECENLSSICLSKVIQKEDQFVKGPMNNNKFHWSEESCGPALDMNTTNDSGAMSDFVSRIVDDFQCDDFIDEFCVISISSSEHSDCAQDGKGTKYSSKNWSDKAAALYKNSSYRKGMWTPEEIHILSENVDNYCRQKGINDPSRIIFEMSKEERSDFYKVIAQGIKRPLFSIYRRIIRMYDRRNYMGKYSPKEIAKLQELHFKYGNNWQTIASLMGRSSSSVKDRCRLLKVASKKGSWMPAEEERLAKAVYERANVSPGMPVTDRISWSDVAARVATRSEKQCRNKWLNSLNWKIASGVDWGRNDDIQLICRLYVCSAEDELQVNWVNLSKAWAACRSPHWLRSRWWSLKRKLPLNPSRTLKEKCADLYKRYSRRVLETAVVQLFVAIRSHCEENVKVRNEGFTKFCLPASAFSELIGLGKHDTSFNEQLRNLLQSAVISQSGKSPKSLCEKGELWMPNYHHPDSDNDTGGRKACWNGVGKSTKKEIESSFVYSDALVKGSELHSPCEENISRTMPDALSDTELPAGRSHLDKTLKCSPSSVVLNDLILSSSSEPSCKGDIL